jgi:hypothetical protein
MADGLRQIRISDGDKAILKRLMELSVMASCMQLGFDHKDDATVMAIQAAQVVQGSSLLQKEMEADGVSVTAAELVRKIQVSIAEVRHGLEKAGVSQKEQL